MKNLSKTSQVSGFMNSFSLNKLFDFLFLLTTLSAVIIPVQKFAERFYWLPWVLAATFYLACRIAQQFQVLEIRVGKSHFQDLAILDHRLSGFRVDSKLYSMIKAVVREEKLSVGFVESLVTLEEQLSLDPIRLKDRRLRKRFREVSKTLEMYNGKIADELFLEGSWHLLPENKRILEPSNYETLPENLRSLRVAHLKAYDELMNQISKLGGDIRDRVYISS
jgi:hypothetical protein